MNENYRIGSVQPEWGKGRAQTLTFVVTEDCNLRCKYCYITHKSNGKVLKLKTAKKFIDYILVKVMLLYWTLLVVSLFWNQN